MFNVSALLLDDALKPATPLIAPLVRENETLSRAHEIKFFRMSLRGLRIHPGVYLDFLSMGMAYLLGVADQTHFANVPFLPICRSTTFYIVNSAWLGGAKFFGGGSTPPMGWLDKPLYTTRRVDTVSLFYTSSGCDAKYIST